jgi:hypothetical protein
VTRHKHPPARCYPFADRYAPSTAKHIVSRPFIPVSVPQHREAIQSCVTAAIAAPFAPYVEMLRVLHLQYIYNAGIPQVMRFFASEASVLVQVVAPVASSAAMSLPEQPPEPRYRGNQRCQFINLRVLKAGWVLGMRPVVVPGHCSSAHNNSGVSRPLHIEAISTGEPGCMSISIWPEIPCTDWYLCWIFVALQPYSRQCVASSSQESRSHRDVSYSEHPCLSSLQQYQVASSTCYFMFHNTTTPVLSNVQQKQHWL